MGRPKKKEIVLSKDSVLSLMQEIYNELVEQRATAVRIQNKMLNMLKDPEDMTVIGPVIKEQQKIINDTIEKKLTLSKLQSTIWEKSQNNSEETFNLAEMDEDVLSALIQKDTEKDGDNQGGYKLD
jgi:methionine salvage enolase-phosphatase E1